MLHFFLTAIASAMLYGTLIAIFKINAMRLERMCEQSTVGEKLKSVYTYEDVELPEDMKNLLRKIDTVS